VQGAHVCTRCVSARYQTRFGEHLINIAFAHETKSAQVGMEIYPNGKVYLDKFQELKREGACFIMQGLVPASDVDDQ
jgi:hypothetical protein